MATFTQGSRSRILIAEQVDFETAATDNFRALPVNSYGVNLTKSTVESGELRPDRQITINRQGNRTVGGDLTIECRDNDIDLLFEGAFQNDFTDVVEGTSPNQRTIPTLVAGTSLKFFTIEDGMEDVDVYRLYDGCSVGNMSLSISPDAMVLGTFSFIGRDMTTGTTTVDTSPTQPTSTEPWDAFTGSVELDGINITSLSSFDFNIDNGLAPIHTIGSDASRQTSYGRHNVSGNLTAYFEDLALYNRFVNEEESSLTINLNNRSQSATDTGYRFHFPRIKLNSGDLSVQDEQSRLISMEFQALRDPTAGYTLRLQKRL